MVTLEQLLYPIAKRLQWYYRNQYGTSKFLIILGALHIEMQVLSALGDSVDNSGSGWFVKRKSNINWEPITCFRA